MLLGSAIQSIGSACESDWLLRCHRVHTAVTASSPHDTCAAESTARQQQPSAVSLLVGAQPGAVQRIEQGRYDRSTAGAFVAFMQRHTPPLPRSRRIIEQNPHAVRADPSRVNNAAIVHAPQEGIMLKDSPLHACKSCHGCPKRALDGSPRPCVLALHELRLPDAFFHGGQWHPPVPYRVREGDHRCQGVEDRVELASRHH